MNGHMLLVGVLSGVLTAIKTDWDAFKNFKDFHEAASYNWTLVAWRVFQGALIGLAGAAGLGSYFG